MPVYRSVRVVFQNSTNQVLTVQGLATLRGQWTDKMAPRQGDEVPPQSAVTWMTESTTIGSGTGAFVRLGSVHGYTRLSWSLPWVGRFDFGPEGCAEGLRKEVVIDDKLPDAVVVFCTLHDMRRGERGDDC
ncbi:hypothetical protein [Corallococcus exercitus]|uniref:hypothetical protein n=1 Tax=Corallococcus exercitus TaxID=2316736 RepID=UPI0011C3D3F2|nr:hypothetical protein [Corallococcus exercitus]